MQAILAFVTQHLLIFVSLSKKFEPKESVVLYDSLKTMSIFGQIGLLHFDRLHAPPIEDLPYIFHMESHFQVDQLV